MKYTYQEITDDFGGKMVKRTDENGNEAWIPTNPANSDYSEYLALLETPEALKAENN